MPEQLTKDQRSAVMRKVKAQNNRSTESVVESSLVAHGIENWIKHPSDIPGKPDFVFPSHQVALFVDGCFWHSCPKCKRPLPVKNAEYWRAKIDRNRRRDNRLRRKLRRDGYHVIRVWEHEVKDGRWVKRLCNLLKKIEEQANG
jgi:DNA mismatch endonuclease (patch repair protein)